MKILIAYTASGTSDNPFVRLLADGIRACGYEVVCSVEEFRSNAADYDIVHLQWPEELFRWKAPAPADVDTLEQQLQTLKNNGIPLIYTRHNTLPHHGNPLVAEAYGLVERYARRPLYIWATQPPGVHGGASGFGAAAGRDPAPPLRRAVRHGHYARRQAAARSASRPTGWWCWPSGRSATRRSAGWYGAHSAGCTIRPNSCSRRACGPTPGADRGSKG